MPLMTWRLGDWLGVCKTGIRHRRRPLSRRAPTASAEKLEPRALLAGTAVVRGVTFIDANGDGNTGDDDDAGEIIARGIVVNLTGTSIANELVNASATTDADGTFTFIRVPAGSYKLTAQPGDKLVGTAVPAEVNVGGLDSEVKRDLPLKGLIPPLVSLRMFLNTTTLNSYPFAAAGDGRDAASNDAPTVLGAANLSISATTSTSPTAINRDLAEIFTDQNFDNSEVRFRTSTGNINVELYDKDTPITVDNFYEYANSGRYNDTIFHRLVDSFVLQGGGFKFDDTGNSFPSVSIDPTIKNEPDIVNRSNLANTVAMAKLGSDPNSASSQFFFNLADNSDNLDNQNGGFTVFGKIADTTPSAMTPVTDSVLLGLADTPISNQLSANSAFGELPLNNYTGTNFPTDAAPSNFLRILGIDTVRRDEFLTYTLLSDGSPTTTIDTTLFTATIVNHRLRVTPKSGQQGQADIVVRTTDEFGDSVTATFHVSVAPAGNVAPTATVALSPAQPLIDSTLTATATVADGNSNPVNLTYVWKNGSTVLKTTSATSSLTDTLDLTQSEMASNVSAGDTITIEVTPNDGFVDGTTVTAMQTLNSAPTATVALTPESPLVNSVLTATATSADVNGQPVKLTYVWKVGTTVVQTTSATSSLTDTLDLSKPDISTEAAGNIITVEITPNDGFVDGTTVTATQTLAASNSAPTATVALTPESPPVDSVLTATATSADVNGQPVKLTYVWKVGTTVVQTTSATSSLTDTLDLSKPDISTEAAGNIITVEITPNDGTVDGTTVTATQTLTSSNEVPTVLGAADLDVTFTTSASPTSQNVDLAGIFTDQDFENSEVQFRTSAGNINVELFDEDAPITVANFYEYANSGRYNDSIFHRLVDDFVLQGGGFAFNDATNSFPEVTEDSTIQNEFSATRSNLASTIAMAKLGGDPNSASSQFFFNLGNNSSNLNNQNGGFTVFGKIAGATSTTAVTDSVLLDLADTPISNRQSTNSAFSQLPLNNYAGTSFPTDATPDHFLRILGIDTVRRKEVLSYSLISDDAVVETIDTSLLTAVIVNHRLQITPKANASGQADIVVRATDLSGEFVTTTFRVTVVNDAPTATVAITPTDPTSDSVLTATATTSDANGQPVGLTYVWKKNGTDVLATHDNDNLIDTLDLGQFSLSPDDEISVEVTPNDGTIDGITVTDSVTINVTVV